MIPQLKDLARDTLVRDVLFSSEVSPLLNNCNVCDDSLELPYFQFETQFFFNGVQLNVNDSIYLPSQISNEVLSGILSLCPTLAPEWAILNLIHRDVHNVKLSSLSNINFIGLQLTSLLHKLFVRCRDVSELEFEFVDITPAFFSHYIKPRADHYTKISLSACSNIKDDDVTMFLEHCDNLTTLDISGSSVTDKAFTNVYTLKYPCQSCGIKNSKPLKLEVLNLSECSKLTTKSIRKIVELCGSSLRCLYIGQCANIYATALWYLTGLFKGKEEFLKGNLNDPDHLSCDCDVDPGERNCHVRAANIDDEHKCEPTTSNHSSITDEVYLDPILPTAVTESVEAVAENMIINKISNLALTDASLSSVFNDLQDNEEQSGSSQGRFSTIESVFNALTELSDVQSTMLQSILSCTNSDEASESLASTSAQTSDHDSNHPSAADATKGDVPDPENDHYYTPEPQYTTLDECKEQLVRDFHQLKIISFGAWEELSKVISLKFDDVDVSSHKNFQGSSKSIIKKSSDILNILSAMCQVVYNRYTENIPIDADTNEEDMFVDALSSLDVNNSLKSQIVISESDKLEIQSVLEMAPLVRDKIVFFVQLLGQISSEIKLNELLRVRLKNSIELEAIQREELDKINRLNNELDVLHGLHSRHRTLYRDANQLDQRLEEFEGNANDENVADDHDENEANEEGSVGVVEPPNQLDTDEEQGPELFKLLETEVSLLLQHSKYSHCPDCCMNAYRPQIRELDISGIKYQNEEIAKTALNTFVTINRGLKSLNLSWYCVDNETVNYVAKCSPDLKSVVLRQCEMLSSPVLYSFVNHDLEVLDLFGICWIQDHGILPFLGKRMSSLTSLCLAEASITDASLIDLANYASLRKLDLSWCDDITDYGISTIIQANRNVLTSLSVRQCSIGTDTLKSIALCAKLVKLDVSTAIEFTDETWMPMALNMPELEDLDIGWVSDITNHMLTVLFTHCPRFKRICLDGHKIITTDPFSRVLVYQKDGSVMRSAQYLPVMKYISLQYCNDMDDEELKRIVDACKGSLVIKDYYGDDLVVD